jgi:hypothetical protein
MLKTSGSMFADDVRESSASKTVYDKGPTDGNPTHWISTPSSDAKGERLQSNLMGDRWRIRAWKDPLPEAIN